MFPFSHISLARYDCLPPRYLVFGVWLISIAYALDTIQCSTTKYIYGGTVPIDLSGRTSYLQAR